MLRTNAVSFLPHSTVSTILSDTEIRHPDLKTLGGGKGLLWIVIPGNSTGACNSWSHYIHSQKQREMNAYTFDCAQLQIQFSPGNGNTHGGLGHPYQFIKTIPYRSAGTPKVDDLSLTLFSHVILSCIKLIKALYHRRYDTKVDPPHKRSF